jgi:antitoxin component YwqK of YwqJK toxin-antitoxin module
VLLPALTLLVAASASNFNPAPKAATAAAAVVLRGDVELRDGLLRLRGHSEPFDGTLVEHWSPARRKAEVPVRGGRVDGITRGWYESGVQEVEESFRAGVSHGWRTRWHPNGSLKSRVWIQHGNLCGAFREWHPNGRLARVTPLKAGQADGLVRGWEVDGSSGGLAVVKAGKPVGR